MFKGSIVALVTPMKLNGDIDWSALNALIDWHIESGTHGLVSVGTTGESATLTHQEHTQVIAATVKRAKRKVPVIAGTGSNSTQESVQLTQKAKDVGAKACLVVTPYYNKPNQEGLYRHYSAIADAVDLPIVMYNVPSRTACDLSAQTVGRLASNERIIGIKEACGHPSRVKEIKKLVNDDFIVLSGEDAQTLEMMNYGAVGTISVTANVQPRLMAQFCDSYLSGNTREAKQLDAKLQPMHAAMFVDTNPIPAKWALCAMGRIEPGIRLPLIELSEDRQKTVSAALSGL